MYGLPCAQTEDKEEEQSSKIKISKIGMKPGNFRRINFEITRAPIGSSISVVLVETPLQQRYNLSLECASIRRQRALESFVACSLRSVANSRWSFTNAASTNVATCTL